MVVLSIARLCKVGILVMLELLLFWYDAGKNEAGLWWQRGKNTAKYSSGLRVDISPVIIDIYMLLSPSYAQA
jgi:hypothetical protein